MRALLIGFKVSTLHIGPTVQHVIGNLIFKIGESDCWHLPWQQATVFKSIGTGQDAG